MRIASRCRLAMRCATTNNSDFGRYRIFHAQKSRRGKFSWTKRKLKMQRATCTHSHKAKQGLRAEQGGCAVERRRGRDGSTRCQKPRLKIRIDTRIDPRDIAHFTSTISARPAPKKSHKIRDSIAGEAPCRQWCGRARQERGEGEESSDGGRRRLEIREGRRAFGRAAMAGCRMIDNEVPLGSDDVELANHIIWPDAGFWGGADLNPGPKGESVEALGGCRRGERGEAAGDRRRAGPPLGSDARLEGKATRHPSSRRAAGSVWVCHE